MRRCQRTLADVLHDGEWTPLADAATAAIAAGVYASRFEHDNVTLWTLVNRGDGDFHGVVLDSGRAGARGSTYIEARSCPDRTMP